MVNDKLEIEFNSTKVSSIQILSIDINNYTYKPTTPLNIKAFEKGQFDLSLLKDSSGQSFKPTTEEDMYNVKLSTSSGETTKRVQFLSFGSNKSATSVNVPNEDPYISGQANSSDEIKSSIPEFKALNPAITDDITTLNSIYSKITATAENSNTSKLYSLQNDEVLLLLTIGDENAATDFKMLSSSGKKTLMKSFVKYGDIAGYDHCNTYVLFGNQVLAFADINYEKNTESITITSSNPLPPRK